MNSSSSAPAAVVARSAVLGFYRFYSVGELEAIRRSYANDQTPSLAGLIWWKEAAEEIDADVMQIRLVERVDKMNRFLLIIITGIGG
jgi:hypothetical protein